MQITCINLFHALHNYPFFFNWWLFSLIGGLGLLVKRRYSETLTLSLVSFAAGVLITVSFSDLLPEAIELAEEAAIKPQIILQWTLAAIIGFFLFERSIFWFHHHHAPHKNQPDPVVPMAWLGDTLHNFLDGLVITASFLVNIPLGISTTLAVAAHEIPQEIADFSLFLSRGLSKTKVLTLNSISAFATTLGAVVAFFFWEYLSPIQPHLLAFTAGMFTYIACSDLIPELHTSHRKTQTHLHVILFLLGIGTTLIISSLLHGE